MHVPERKDCPQSRRRSVRNICGQRPSTPLLAIMKLLLALCALASAEPEAMTASNLLKSSAAMLAGGRGSSTSAKQPLKVVAAGLGRTGTASLKEALTKLGLKTYHMKDGVMDTPGHMELWSEHAAKMMQGESGKASANAIMDKMAEDGFNATTDIPSFRTAPFSAGTPTPRSSSRSATARRGPPQSCRRSAGTLMSLAGCRGASSR